MCTVDDLQRSHPCPVNRPYNGPGGLEKQGNTWLNETWWKESHFFICRRIKKESKPRGGPRGITPVKKGYEEWVHT